MRPPLSPPFSILLLFFLFSLLLLSSFLLFFSLSPFFHPNLVSLYSSFLSLIPLSLDPVRQEKEAILNEETV